VLTLSFCHCVSSNCSCACWCLQFFYNLLTNSALLFSLPAKKETEGFNAQRVVVIAATLFHTIVLNAQQPAQSRVDDQWWWSCVKVLAYIVEQITKAGLTSAGTDGFCQSVKFTQHQVDENNSAATLVRDGKEDPPVWVTTRTSVRAAISALSK
jgi:hypothetical protein